MTDDAKMVFGDLFHGCSEREFLDVFGQPSRPPPLVPPDTEAIEWARELDRAARRHDDARTPPERFAAFKAVYSLCVHDERMVQIARALLARVGDQG